MRSLREIQAELVEKGYDLGKWGADGVWGDATKNALLRYADATLFGTAEPPGIVPGQWIIPEDWLPPVKMDRIIIHWTAGSHTASTFDRQHYHVLIEGSGRPVRGIPSIAANQAPVKSGYAAHTLNCNSGSIGLSLCCMGGAIESPFKPGSWPMTKAQWDAAVLAARQIAQRYNIAPSKYTMLSHAEVQGTLGIKQRNKWDITRLAFDPATVGATAVGDRFRAEVKG